jgi:DNA-directed RNA polymerase specialized sigma24 family protein
MSELDDAELLERARRGDEVAFSRLFTRHQRTIYRYAVYMAGAAAGDDIVQETFLAVLRQRRREDLPKSSVLAYLIGIARRLVLKHRAFRGEPAFTEIPDEGGEEPDTGPETWNAVDELTRAELVAAVRAAVQSL